MRFIRNAVVVGAALATLTGIGMATANADPTSTPPLTGIVGVGSDTLTPVYAGSPSENTSGSLTFDYNATSPANGLYSWDAVNPSTGNPGDQIITKASSSTDTTCQIARPNGSGAGITALENSATDNGDPCIDFARSSRAPASTDPSTIAFVAMAGDAIAWSSPTGTTSDPSPAPSTLTFAQLQAIYTCVDTNWSQVGGSSAPIVPVIPQAGSGTRATFLLALGGGTTPLNPANFPCIVNGSNSTGVIEENTGLSAGNVAQFDPSGVPAVDDIYPYSIGDYIAQQTAANGVGGHASSIWGHGVMGLHAMTDDSGTLQQPTTTNSSSQTIINRSYPSELQRLLYNVVRNGGTATAPAFPTSPAYEATALPAIFGSTGWICRNATARADIVGYGFYNLGANCGAMTVG